MAFEVKIASTSEVVSCGRSQVISFILQGGSLTHYIKDMLSQNLQLTLLQRILISNDKAIIMELEREFDMPVTGQLDYFLANYPICCYTKNWRDYHSPTNCISLMIADGQLEEIKAHAETFKTADLRTFHIISAARRGYHDTLNHVIIYRNSHANRVIEGYAAANNIGVVENMMIEGYSIWQLLMGAAAGGHINLLRTFIPIYKIDNGYDLSHTAVVDIVKWGLRFKQIALVKYLLKLYDYPIGFWHHRKESMVEYGFLSGDLETITYILTLTGITVTEHYLPYIAASGNIKLLEQYRAILGEAAFLSRYGKMLNEAFQYRKHHMVAHLVTTTNDDWDHLLSRAVYNYSIPLVCLALESGATNVEEELKEAKQSEKFALVRLLEDFLQREVQD